MTCIPASRYLRIDNVVIDSGVVMRGHVMDYKKEPQTLRAWHNAGLSEVGKVRATCKWTGSALSVRIDRQPYRETGQCGGKPAVELTLTRNGLPLVKRMRFGEDCYGYFGVMSLQLSDDSMTVCAARWGDVIQKCGDPGQFGAIGTRRPETVDSREVMKVIRHPPLVPDEFEEIVKKKSFR